MSGLVVRWRNDWEEAEEELDVAVESQKPAPAAIDTEKTLDLATVAVDDARIRASTVALTIAAVVFGCAALAFTWLAIAP